MPVQKRVTGNPVKMHENWLRTACGRSILRPSATRIRTARQRCPTGRTTPAEPHRSRRACCFRGRFPGSTSSAPRDDQAGLRSGQDQNARRQQTDRKMVHARCAEK